MTEKLRPVTVITGASAGIGVALARLFARDGYELVLVARREDRLRALADEIAATGKPKPLVIAADLARSDAGKLIADKLTALGVEPQYIVNNAGYGLAGLAGSRERDDELGMIDLNVRALTELSLAFIDSLARHRGGILNVGSLAGFLPGPGMAIYYATKAYVLSFSEALHTELKSRGVRVTVLVSGSGADRICRARRGEQRAGAGIPHPERRAGGRAGLSRLDARAARGHPGCRQQTHGFADSIDSALAAAGGGRQPAKPAQIRAKVIAAIRRPCCKRR